MPKAHIIDGNAPGPIPDIPGPEIQYHIIAEGDSWFTMSGFPINNLLQHLEFPDTARITNYATPGHEIVADMAKAVTNAFKQDLNTDGRNWNLILISGGGNDFFAAAETSKAGQPDSLLFDAKGEHRPNIADYCNLDAINALVTRVQEGYGTIAAMRPENSIPILGHTYDYCMPRDAPVIRGFIGPWLYRGFRRFNIPEEDWVDLSRFLLKQLAEGILALQTTIPNFHVVNTRNTLTMAEPGTTGDSNHWRNEIHPNRDGYKKLGAKFTDTIRELLHA